MNKKSNFTIYDASAGSGKTYTIVKEYLKIVLAAKSDYLFKQILAITFTNKAVAEMKTRIIDTLKTFSETQILETPRPMFLAISEELQIPPADLHKKSKKILNNIIHNYGAFDISTIDGFTHKLIRTFAHDLKLPLNFEVELDQESLLNQAVENLINKAGTDKKLTEVLVDFAIEKADDDKSWDLTYDFNKVAKLLVNENDIPFVEKLKGKTMTDFMALKKQLHADIKILKEQIRAQAQATLALIEEAGLEFDDFSRGSLPNHFDKLAHGDFNVNFDAQWHEDIENKTLYPKRVNEHIAGIIDQIQPELAQAFNQTQQAVFHLKFLANFYKNITPLSVLNALNKELFALKAEQNKMLISEFNTIISKEIKDQPTPFIYERLGEKFKHYFIDEFQDTSVNQWQNLIPLLDNSLASDQGSVVLVGDAKQAIYRWRGGKAEQFIGLHTHDNPFVVEKALEHLPKNYRSFQDIVTFNNGLFQFLADSVFSNSDYQDLYSQAYQEANHTEQGFVSLDFLDINKDDDRDLAFCQKTFETVQSCLKNGYLLADICILVRKKKEGVAIAQYLSEHDTPIISSETLLLANAKEVQFILHVLQLLVEPANNEIKIVVLNELARLLCIEDKHAFFTHHLNLNLSDFFTALKVYDISVQSDQLVQLPFYDLVETLVRAFGLTKKSNAYIQFFLDVVLDFYQKKGSDIASFLTYFDKNKDSLSIVSPVGQNAVQIMTIHKAKGLEFPVVIFPYADLDIYKENEPKTWFHINPENYQGFSETLLNFNKDLDYFGEEGSQLFNKRRGELELDNINLLYVALTRPIAALYIISKIEITSKGIINTNKFSGLFITYLDHLNLWDASKANYTFGQPSLGNQVPDKLEVQTLIPSSFISTPQDQHNIKMVTKSGYLWDTKQKLAIEKGNLIHAIMAKIVSKNEVEMVLQDFFNQGILSEEQWPLLKEQVTLIVEHPKLSPYFKTNVHTYNERDIITRDGLIYRPDRVVINSTNEAVIIDYKTGIEDQKHAQQLQGYQDVLETMNFVVKKKILVYTNDTIFVKEV